MSLLAKIIKQCRCTFEPMNREVFQKNFTVLKELVGGLTYTELGLHPELVSKRTFAVNDKAPCTFINVFECDLFTLTIFILRPAFSMPIHDHPGITGILKMIYGTGKIQSYTRTQYEQGLQLVRVGSRIEVNEQTPLILDASNGVAVLTPSVENFHEVSTVGDTPCAFFDVLSPPFGEGSGNPRQCSYYQKLVAAPGQVFLEKIAAPYSYYCDSYNYELPDDCEVINV